MHTMSQMISVATQQGAEAPWDASPAPAVAKLRARPGTPRLPDDKDDSQYPRLPTDQEKQLIIRAAELGRPEDNVYSDYAWRVLIYVLFLRGHRDRVLNEGWRTQEDKDYLAWLVNEIYKFEELFMAVEKAENAFNEERERREGISEAR